MPPRYGREPGKRSWELTMYIFMYIIYILSALSFGGMTLLGIGGFLGPHGYFGMNHPTFALLVVVIFLAAEVLVMFFFVGTGVSIKEYVRDHPDADPELHRRSIAIKRALYPPTLNVTLIVMLTFILGGAVDRNMISHWWHLGSWVLSMWMFMRALRVQNRCLADNTAIILEMVGLRLGEPAPDNEQEVTS